MTTVDLSYQVSQVSLPIHLERALLGTELPKYANGLDSVVLTILLSDAG